MSAFKPASRTRKKLRIALMGPASSGKTFSALAIASGLGGRIALIDSEHGSASIYGAGDPFHFDTLELGSFDPRLYVQAIQDAEAEGYRVIIIDSLSHAWTGKGGALELVDKFAARSKSGNKFTEGWGQVTPIQNQLIDAIISSPAHIIATMRTKVEYTTETDVRTGKMAPKKVGLAPIQREGMDYEFDIVGEMDIDHNLIVAKTRWSRLDGEVMRKPGVEFGKMLLGWLNDAPEVISAAPAGSRTSAPLPGRPVHSPAIQAPPATQQGQALGLATPEHVAELRSLFAAIGLSEFQVREALAKRGAAVVESLSVEDAQAMIHKIRAHLEGVTAADQIQAQIQGANPEEAAQQAGARPANEASSFKPETTKMGHVLLTPETCPDRLKDPEGHTRRDRNCHVCDDGFGICAICGMAEVELDQPCPGHKAEPLVSPDVSPVDQSAETSPDDFVIPDQARRDAPSTSSSSSGSGSRPSRKGKTALANEAVTQPVTS